ncbi:MAG: PepSY domain-containing protein [Gammaproteobacteria bacterium]
MKSYLKKPVFAAMCISGILVAGAANADRDDIRALTDAKITLIQAIQAAESAEGGQAFDASIDDDSFRPEYEVNIVRDGRVYEMRIDAVAGEVIGTREDRDD